MEPMTMSLAASVAAPVVGGLVGNLLGKSDRKRAQAAIAQAMKELESVGLPPDLSKEIIQQQFQNAGILTPEMEQDLGDVNSAMGGYSENQSLVKTQEDALRQLQQKSRQGLSLQDKLNLSDIERENAIDEEAKRQQIMQNFQARGQGGSGAELMSQLQAQQSGADRQARQSLAVGAQASQDALNALMNRGQMAGQMRSQDLNTAQATLGARDAMSQFNAQNSIGRQQRNVGSLNQAQAANLQNQQNIANMNTQQANQEKLRQVQEKGNLYDRTLGYKQTLANARLGQAGNYQAQADRTAQQYAGIGSGIGAGFQAYNNQQQNQNILDQLKAINKG